MNDKHCAFLNRMKDMLGDDFEAFDKSLSEPSQKSLYVNENKISVEKFKELVDFDIEQIPYEKAGFYIDEEKRGRHSLHHAGVFYLQEPSAMFTVNAYNFKGDEKVLDMCAAPGGKSIQIANRIPNGVLVSNEIVSSRSQILFSNILSYKHTQANQATFNRNDKYQYQLYQKKKNKQPTSGLG